MPFKHAFRQTRRLLLGLLLTSPASVPAFAGSFAFVTNQSSSDLSILDLEAREEIRRIPVPGDPAGVAVGASLRSFFTVSPNSKTVRRFSLATCRIEASVELPGGPTGIAFDAHSRRLFISDWYNARIFVLDAGDLTLLGELTTGSAPAGLVVSRDGRLLASADRDANQVSLFSLADLSLIARIPVGLRPYGISEDPEGRIHAGNVGSNSVSVIDPDTASVITTVAVGDHPYGIGFANGKAFTTNQYADTLSIYRLSDFELEATLDVGEYPEGIDTTANGAMIVSTNWFSNTLSLIDPVKLDVVGEIETGDGPRAFGRFLYEGAPGEKPCQEN